MDTYILSRNFSPKLIQTGPDYMLSHGDIYKKGDRIVVADNYTDDINGSKYVIAIGFYSSGGTYYVHTSNDDIIEESSFRDPTDIEANKFSKYVDTVILRTYLNDRYWNAKTTHTSSKGSLRVKARTGSKNREEPQHIGPHFHVDELNEQYGGDLTILYDGAKSQTYAGRRIYTAYGDLAGMPTMYISSSFDGGRHGVMNEDFSGRRTEIDWHGAWNAIYNHPYERKRMLCGSCLTGTFLLDSYPYNLADFYKGRYDERDPIYVIRVEDPAPSNYLGLTSLWDPVSDIIRVEKISGNNTFISEFGYICSMNMYALITGPEYSRWLMRTILD